MGIKVKRVEEGIYDVYFDSLLLGTVRKNEADSFWSYARWSIDGEPCTKVRGGVLNKTIKNSGYTKRRHAVNRLARMKSAEILKTLP